MSSAMPLSAALVPDQDAPLFIVSFSVQACAEPGVMPRVIELFAKRGLVPQKWHSTAAGPLLTIDVQIGEIGRDLADYMACCMRQVVGVETVLTIETSCAG